LDLVICIAAAQRRGLMDAAESKRQGLDGDNILEGFRISGLGQLIEGGIQSDRTLVFGD
jgi:tRNA 2-thiouridine synthesizing protein D